MNCRRVENLMSAYVDGELTGVEMLEIRRHLSDCEGCSSEYEAERALKQAVARLSTVSPRRDFAADILTRLDEVTVPAHQKALNSFLRFVHDKVSPVAAAVAASGVALILLSSGGVDRISPAPSGQQGSQVAFVRDYEASSVPIDSAKPLVIASESSDLGGTTIQFASLTSR